MLCNGEGEYLLIMECMRRDCEYVMSLLSGSIPSFSNNGVQCAYLCAFATVRIAFFCAFSSLVMFFCDVQPYMGKQYNRWGCTSEKYNVFSEFVLRRFLDLLIM